MSPQTTSLFSPHPLASSISGASAVSEEHTRVNYNNRQEERGCPPVVRSSSGTYDSGIVISASMGGDEIVDVKRQLGSPLHETNEEVWLGVWWLHVFSDCIFIVVTHVHVCKSGIYIVGIIISNHSSILYFVWRTCYM